MRSDFPDINPSERSCNSDHNFDHNTLRVTSTGVDSSVQYATNFCQKSEKNK